MQASYSNGKMIEEAHETFHAAFLSGEEHMEKGAESVHLQPEAQPQT